MRMQVMGMYMENHWQVMGYHNEMTMIPMVSMIYQTMMLLMTMELLIDVMLHDHIHNYYDRHILVDGSVVVAAVDEWDFVP